MPTSVVMHQTWLHTQITHTMNISINTMCTQVMYKVELVSEYVSWVAVGFTLCWLVVYIYKLFMLSFSHCFITWPIDVLDLYMLMKCVMMYSVLLNCCRVNYKCSIQKKDNRSWSLQKREVVTWSWRKTVFYIGYLHCFVPAIIYYFISDKWALSSGMELLGFNIYIGVWMSNVIKMLSFVKYYLAIRKMLFNNWGKVLRLLNLS